MNATQLNARPMRDLARYYPEEDSIWMVAMIIIGCAFILFVVITMSIICKSTIKQWKQTEQSNELPRPMQMRNFGSTSFLQFEEEISVSRLNVNYEF